MHLLQLEVVRPTEVWQQLALTVVDINRKGVVEVDRIWAVPNQVTQCPRGPPAGSLASMA